MPFPALKAHLAYYRSQHSTLGCKLTHLFGVPLIAISIPLLLFDRKKAILLFSVGWFLQFLGHFVFERNRPVLMTRDRHPYTILSALVFVGQGWVDTLKSIRQDFFDESNGKKSLPLRRDR